MLRHKKRKNYRTHIFLTYFAYSYLTLAILSCVVAITFYSIMKGNMESQISGNLAQVNNGIARMVSDGKGIIDTLDQEALFDHWLSDPEMTDQDILRELYLVRNSMGKEIELSVIRRDNGDWVSTNAVHKEANLLRDNLSNWGIFRMANESDEAVVLPTVKNNFLSTNDRIMIAKADRLQGEIQGYYLIEITRSALAEVVGEQANPYHTAFLIGTEKESVIFHSDGANLEGLDQLKKISLEELPDNEKETFHWSGYLGMYNGELELYYFWGIPSNILTGIIRLLSRILLISLLVVLVICFLLSRYLADGIVKPVQDLRASMSRMKHGDLSVRVNVDREDEFGELGKSFNSMADRIEVLMKNIDEKQHSLWVAETRSLNLQMNPHFLYNTLDVIKWEARLGKTEEIGKITVQLERLLRKVMSTQDDLVPISYEMELIEAFIGIMKYHHEDLELRENLAPEIQGMIIPKLVLQPIVENAIVHGFEDLDGKCRIQISGRLEDPYLIFEVQDNGNGMSVEEMADVLDFRQTNTHHIGLSNVQKRAQLYGDESCGMKIMSKPGEGTTVVLKLKKM